MTSPTPLTVLHSDEDVIVIDKPAGLPVIPAAGESPDDCVRRRLERQLGEPLWVVHRLDRATSGVLAFARSAEAHRRLNQAFESRTVSKTYLAVTSGVPHPPAGTIDVALRDARRGRSRPCAPGEQGGAARTEYLVERIWTGPASTAALVRAHPLTGRHHQIRVHLRWAGTPILFDEIYGRSTVKGEWAAAPCRRLALHALRLELPSSGNGPALHIDAPVAADIAALIAWFDARWADSPTRAAGTGAVISSLR